MSDDHARRIKKLEEECNQLGMRTAKLDKDFKNQNWRLDNLDKKTSSVAMTPRTEEIQMSPMSKDVGSVNSVDNMENLKTEGTEDGEQARLLNRMLTYLRKLEMKIDDKADRLYVDDELRELRSLMEQKLAMQAETSD